MNNISFSVSGQIVDIIAGRIFSGTINISNGKIVEIREEDVKEKYCILPGLIDSHIHIESSMLIPSEFARLAVTHGTVATVSDPHEIANVLGMEGIDFMIENGNKVPFKFYFGASSCVPATTFETAGAVIDAAKIDTLLQSDRIKYLSEMMNWPGVLFGDKEVYKKLEIAKKYSKPIDGHAPGVMGEDAKKYIEAGISTDHECFTLEEALDKIKYGMKILIREGSAAKNFEALIDLMKDHPDMIMFCSDDRHPNDLVKGHIDEHVIRAITKGYDPLTVLKVATLNPVKHYNLDVGLLQKGDDADFIIINDLKKFDVLSTWIKGVKVAEKGKTLISSVKEKTPNNFHIKNISTSDLQLEPEGSKIRVIEALDGQLITNEIDIDPFLDEKSNNVISNPDHDVLKMVVVNRYQQAKPAVAFVCNFGLKNGAIASSVAHDSHNIVAVGVSDEEIARAINLVIDNAGGITAVDGHDEKVLPLPVAGIMTNTDGYQVAQQYEELDKFAKQNGASLHAPYMTLSFMALLVIPNLKLSDKGLFDGSKFEFTSLFVNP